MRFVQYKGVLELIDSVIEATEYMKVHSSAELCALCAQSLHSVLNTIEGEENSKELIIMINDACDCFENEVYDSDDFLEFVKSIKEKASRALKYRLRVLFVAELGGKWDSMASVYKAFCERDDCDVDVVLEPIFREVQYTDGSKKKEVIYNDWLTPLGIKHVFYDQYNMAKIRPDMTFFSQPYESCTTPMFWPCNMSKYTRLVFLPYYSPFRVNPNNPISFNILFKSDTEKYSWRIACQSDVVKEYYVKYATNQGKNVIVSGLPKWDYVFNISKENNPCPKEWEKKIAGRKVFLWNTHFEIANSDLIDDYEEFVDIFDSSKDKALIWRPHPMLETIIKLYHPEKYGKYMELISKIKNSSNMVIDDNYFYGQSFIWSDAMISSFSSLALQYLFLDKPIFLFTTNSNSDDEVLESRRYENEVFDYTKIPFSNSINNIKKFIEDVCNKGNLWNKEMNELKNKYYYLADGKVGEKLVKMLIKDFLEFS